MICVDSGKQSESDVICNFMVLEKGNYGLSGIN